MYLKDFSNYGIDDQNAKGEFTLALVTEDTDSMIQWARPFLKSIRTGSPEVVIVNEETVREWELKSLQFLEENRL